MSQPYIGEIRMFGGSFAPAGWAFCDGSQQAISENDALFTLIGTTYGGDGQSTFNLPDLRGRTPMHVGPNYVLGENGGTESITLNTQQLPSHGHPMVAAGAAADAVTPTGGFPSFPPSLAMYFNADPDAALSPSAVLPVGGSQPHENMQPYLAISFIISLFGIFPTQG
jgi:microcystin-dependent protein